MHSLVLTGLGLLSVFLFFESTALDLVIQDYFFNFESAQWLLDADQPVFKFIFYTGIKKLFIFFVLSVLIALVFFRAKAWVKKHKKGLLIVLFSCISVPLVVGFLKSATNTPCPKDIQRYGGIYPHGYVLKAYPSHFLQPQDSIRCYPAGHASGGFALMSLFFLFSARRMKRTALKVSLGIGWATGFYKMLIGDHFLSHTMVSMFIAWLLILLIKQLVERFYRKTL
jgi:membrane-associated PAP2 superfamily phosphatase